jgi:transcriptional regulator with XRE-family HTH domain
MPSSKFNIDKRRKTYIRLIGDITHQLNTALHEENERRGLTRTQVAEVLGTNKSFVTRKLDGRSNMTLETLADLAYALDRVVSVELRSREKRPGSNNPVVSASTTGTGEPAKIEPPKPILITTPSS